MASVDIDRVLTVVICCLALVLTVLVFYKSNETSQGFSPRPLVHFKNNSSSSGVHQLVPVNFTGPQPSLNSSIATAPSPYSEILGNGLERVLKNAAMDDKTVILTTLNEAWASPDSVFDLFLESFKIGDGTSGLLKHLVVVALDQKAYNRCLAVHGRCYAVATEGIDFSHQATFMSDEYLKMMWRRIDFLCTVLELGYNFVFTDTDVMWFRNPFPHFYSAADFQIACDHFTGNPDDKKNLPNGGFNFVRSSNKSVEFYKFWYSSRERYPRKHDQDVLNMIKSDSFVTKIGLKMKFLSTAYFGGLCEPSKDLNLVCTMHANCCVGLEKKIDDLKIMLDDWRNYISLADDVRKSSTHRWRVPRSCSSGHRRL